MINTYFSPFDELKSFLGQTSDTVLKDMISVKLRRKYELTE